MDIGIVAIRPSCYPSCGVQSRPVSVWPVRNRAAGAGSSTGPPDHRTTLRRLSMEGRRGRNGAPTLQGYGPVTIRTKPIRRAFFARFTRTKTRTKPYRDPYQARVKGRKEKGEMGNQKVEMGKASVGQLLRSAWLHFLPLPASCGEGTPRPSATGCGHGKCALR